MRTTVKLKRTVATLGLSRMLMGTVGLTAASAAPTNSPSASTDVVTGTDGTSSWEAAVVSVSDAMWGAGHVVAIDGVTTHVSYVPRAPSGTFYPDEPIGGQSVIEAFSIQKSGNRKGVTNTFEYSLDPISISADDPENSFGVSGTLIFTIYGYAAGNSH